jgi:ABC-type polysaccharide/polyol phosphate export permease
MADMVEMQGGTSVTGYLSDIWRLRHFWTALVRIDLRNRYRRSTIGIGWSLLHPIAMTVVFCVVFSQFFGQNWREYGPYVLAGLIFWNFITSGMNQGCQCFFQGESYIRQHPAPLAIYPLRTALGAGIHFMFGLCVLLTFAWMVNGFGNLPFLLSLVPTLMLLFIFCWALAICMGVLNVLFQDCQHLIEVLLQILFYLTPIMYDPNKLHLGRFLLRIVNLNPLAIMLKMLRQPILDGQLPSLGTYALGASVAILAVAAAVLTLMRFERRMIFYL